MKDKILMVNDVNKSYEIENNRYDVLKGITFSCNKGEFVSIMGASGSGKTTLLNIISAIDKPTHGQVLINGIDVALMSDKDLSNFRKRGLGYIFQDFNLLDILTIEENIALPLLINKYNSNLIKKKVTDIAEKLQINNILSKFPYEVSGGEKQRCACARAIICEPNIILADEPSGSLDSQTTESLLSSIQNMNKEFNITILMVTHDINVASYTDRVIFIKDGVVNQELHKNSKEQKEFHKLIFNKFALISEVD